MSQPWLTSLMSQHGGSTPEKPLLARRRLYSIQGLSLVGPVGRGETIRNLPPKLGDVLMGTEKGWVLCEAHTNFVYFTILETYPSSNGQIRIFNSYLVSIIVSL